MNYPMRFSLIGGDWPVVILLIYLLLLCIWHALFDHTTNNKHILYNAHVYGAKRLDLVKRISAIFHHLEEQPNLRLLLQVINQVFLLPSAGHPDINLCFNIYIYTHNFFTDQVQYSIKMIIMLTLALIYIYILYVIQTIWVKSSGIVSEIYAWQRFQWRTPSLARCVRVCHFIPSPLAWPATTSPQVCPEAAKL